MIALKDVLNFKIDSYKCVSLHLKEQNLKFIASNENEIDEKIKFIVDEFKKSGIKAIWVIIPIEVSYLIKFLARNNFMFHHTENNNELIMYNFLLSSPNNLPKYASHYLGVGALIINKFGKILLVKEKNTIKQLEDKWKIPTGLSEKGESIEQTVIREVKEETNLNIEFKGILSCREAHPYLFDTSDIFFICLCVCENEKNINIIKGGELKEFKWFAKDEIEYLLINKKFSLFSANFFRSILKSLPNEIYNKAMSTGKEVKFLKSKFIFHYPKF